MGSAHDATPIIADCQSAVRVAIVDHNTRRNSKLKAEIAAERTACRTIHMPDPDKVGLVEASLPALRPSDDRSD
nr:hypothetical protein [uncultured Rhodopila sp.]